MDKNMQTSYVKLGEDGLPNDFYVSSDEHWARIEATSEDELQEKMKTFQPRSN